MMNFGEKLKTLRVKSGKSQARVAQEIANVFPESNISQAYLSNLENRTAAPRQELLEVFAQYYRKPLAFFLSSTRGANGDLALANAYIDAIVDNVNAHNSVFTFEDVLIGETVFTDTSNNSLDW